MAQRGRQQRRPEASGPAPASDRPAQPRAERGATSSALQRYKPQLPMSEEREVAVLASVICVMVLGALALALIDAGTFPQATLGPALLMMALILFLGPAWLSDLLRRKRDAARSAGRDFPLERYKRRLVGSLAVAAVGVLVYIVFFASGV